MVSFKNIGKSGILFLAMFFATTICLSQTRVTGHVFAEIIEATSAESKVSSFIALERNNTVSDFSLGEISTSGKANATFSVIFDIDGMKGDNGNKAFFEASISAECSGDILNDNGKQVFSLLGKPSDEILSQNSKLYDAQYQIVFAYN